MVNREMKLVIGDELRTLFSSNCQAAEETRKEHTPMKKTLTTDIDGALNRTTKAPSKPPQPLNSKYVDITFGLHARQDGQLGMGNKVASFDAIGKTLTVDDRGYKLTP